jgi:hypothetical protein
VTYIIGILGAIVNVFGWPENVFLIILEAGVNGLPDTLAEKIITHDGE